MYYLVREGRIFATLLPLWETLGLMLSNNHSKNIGEKFYFLSKIEDYGKSSTSVFEEVFTSTDKIFISKG